MLAIEFEGKSLLFSQPQFALSTSNPNEVNEVLKEVERSSKKYFMAGFLSYEAGYAFEEVFSPLRKKSAFPLVYFAAFRKPEPFISKENLSDIKIFNLGNSLGRGEYFCGIKTIKELIAEGQTYQINYTFKRKFHFEGRPLDLYLRLKKIQPVPYSACLETDDFSVVSLSPELFFKVNGGQIAARPMKGTMAIREGAKERLAGDAKNRAENLMIVDLFRNDLGRVSQVGSVAAPKLFEVSRYRTLFQMTSTVCGALRPKVGFYEIFKNLFPSGSVTGAPKIKSMEIIAGLEKEPRRIYTGSIGYLSPSGEMKFNVAIRTLLLEGNRGEMGIGGGIVWDSEAEKEYAECLLKSSFFTSLVNNPGTCG